MTWQRCHLANLEARKRRIAELKAQGLSTRAIAEEVGVDQSTVVRTGECSTDALASVEQAPPKVTGLDGKARPAEQASPEGRAARDAQIAEAIGAGATVREAAATAGVWATIPAVVTDAPSLRAERDENEVRKDFTPSERVEMARLIAAQIPERRGRPTEGGEIVENIPQIDVPPGEKTREFIAKQAGFGNERTMRQAELVVDSDNPDLVEAMDQGDLSRRG